MSAGGADRLASVAGAVLLGGASSRMGADKARLEIDGVPAAVRAAELLASLFEEVLVVGGDPPAAAPGRRVTDPEGPRCALRGLVAALSAARAPRVLVVATDLPLLCPELLLALVAWPEADVVVPRRERRLEPLCALWARDAALAPARARLAAGRLALHELVADLDSRVLEGADLVAADPEGLALANANAPEEWARLAALARERAPRRSGAPAPSKRERTEEDPWPSAFPCSFRPPWPCSSRRRPPRRARCAGPSTAASASRCSR